MPQTSQKFNLELRLYLATAYLILSLLTVGMSRAKNLTFGDLNIHEAAKVAGSFNVQTTPEWQSQPSGTSQVLLGVSFTDINKGYAVGTNGVIRVTSDGGNTWSAQPSGTSRFLRDVYFSDAAHGVIVGESGLILRTTDGTTWNQQNSGTVQHLVHVHFLNNSIGIATGQGGVILKTTDGGITWTTQNSGTSVELPGAFMIDVNTAVVVGFGGTILRTANGGSSWVSVPVSGFTSDLRSVDFFGGTGIAVSMGGGILKSTDGGQSWTNISSGTANNLYAVRFRDGNTVYAVGTATVLVSNNGGSSWATATTTPFGGDLYGVAFSSGKGWAVGQNGLILHAESAPTPTPTPTPSPLQLLLDQSGPDPSQVAALDSVLFLRDPFTVLNEANFFTPGNDRNSRLVVFVTNLQLAQGETSSSVVVNLIDANNQSYDITAEDVRFVPNFDFTQVVIRLPNNLAVGSCTVKVRAHGQVSNSGTFRIRI